MTIESAIPSHAFAYTRREPRLDPHGRLDEDIPCRSCSYNLRGQLPDGRCPECATLIGRSLQGEFLRFCNPQWVNTLATGMTALLASLMVGFFGGMLLGLVMAVMQIQASIVPNGFTILVGLAGVYGYWLLSTPDPGRSEEEKTTNVRHLLRWSQAASWGLFSIHLIFAELGAMALGWLTFAWSAAGFVGFYAMFVYARRLALRIPDANLARNCRIVMWGVTITSLLAICAMVVMGVFLASVPSVARTTTAGVSTSAPVSRSFSLVYRFPSTPSSAPATPVPPTWAITSGIGICFFSILILIFAIWTLVLMFRFRTAFKLAASQASATWNASIFPAAPQSPS